MREEQYKNLNIAVTQTKSKSSLVKTLNDILPLIMMVFYPIQLFYLLFSNGFIKGVQSEQFLKFAIVPICFFLLITIVKTIINAKRPYEEYKYTPVSRTVPKGGSFPSVFAGLAFIIAMAFLYISTSIGVIMIVIATLISITRVLTGLHYVRDVLVGGALGIVVGIVCFFLI